MSNTDFPPLDSSSGASHAGAPQGAAPQGWYPDGSGASIQRWWDGAQWTDHVYDTATSVYAPPAGFSPARALTPETSPYTPFIWVIVLLPVLSLIAFLSWDLNGFLAASMLQSSGRLGSSNALASLYSPGYLILVGAGWVIYIATVILAYFDYRALGQRGLTRRFHWAWSFLGVLVYIIGRTVVVRSQLKRGMLVLWVFIALELVILIIAVVKFVGAFAAVMPMLGGPTYR